MQDPLGDVCGGQVRKGLVDGLCHHHQGTVLQVCRDGEWVVREALHRHGQKPRPIAGAERFGHRTDRGILEDEQGVEETAVPCGTLHRRQTEIAEIAHARRVSLQCRKTFCHRCAGFEDDHRGNSVDEQTDHALDAWQGVRPTRDGGAEHHVTPIGQPSQHHCPGVLDNGVHRQTLGPCPRCQPGGVGPVQLNSRAPGDRIRLGPSAFGEHHRTTQRREVVDPTRQRGVIVLRCQPADVVAVWTRQRQ